MGKSTDSSMESLRIVRIPKTPIINAEIAIGTIT